MYFEIVLGLVVRFVSPFRLKCSNANTFSFFHNVLVFLTEIVKSTYRDQSVPVIDDGRKTSNRRSYTFHGKDSAFHDSSEILFMQIFDAPGFLDARSFW